MTEADFLLIASNEFPKEKELSLDKEYRQIEGWNSLNALIFINQIKEKSDVLISPKILSETKTLKDLYTYTLK